jgi:hypothetical protein
MFTGLVSLISGYCLHFVEGDKRVRYELLTAVNMQIICTVLWDVIPYVFIEMYQYFGRNCCLRFWGNLKIETVDWYVSRKYTVSHPRRP